MTPTKGRPNQKYRSQKECTAGNHVKTLRNTLGYQTLNPKLKKFGCGMDITSSNFQKTESNSSLTMSYHRTRVSDRSDL